MERDQERYRGYTYEEMIAQCAFYKGDDVDPKKDGDKDYLWWYYEQRWVEQMMGKDDNDGNDIDYIGEYRNSWHESGISDFCKNDGRDSSLKALLLSRFVHWSSLSEEGGIRNFKAFYIEHYAKNIYDIARMPKKCPYCHNEVVPISGLDAIAECKNCGRIFRKLHFPRNSKQLAINHLKESDDDSIYRGVEYLGMCDKHMVYSPIISPDICWDGFDYLFVDQEGNVKEMIEGVDCFFYYGRSIKRQIQQP